MINRESLKFEDDHPLLISARRECESLKGKFFELYVLYALSKSMNLSLEQEELFGKTIKLLKELLEIEDFCFMLLDEKCNELKMWKASSDAYEHVKEVSFKIGEGISGIVFKTGEPILINNASNEERFLYYKGKIPDIGSFLSVPLKLSCGKIIGVLNIQERGIDAFKEKDKALFSAIAENIAHTIERVRRYEKARKESMFDDLTALYTRRYFLESCYQECSKVERYGKNFSIVIADIDYFKYFNDTYGHAMGDEILKKLATILKSNVRQGDVVSRYGGEEFAILLPETDKDGATLIADKLRNVVESELTNETRDRMIVTITAGVATCPDDGKTVGETIAAADKYLYIGKEGGRNRVVNRALDTAPDTRDEKRDKSRYKTALKITRGTNHVQSIEIKVNNNEWVICAIKDISDNGFKGEVELETNIDNDYMCNDYLCKVVTDQEVGVTKIFSIRIAHAIKIHQNHRSRYLVGVEILNEHDSWERFFNLLKH